METITIGDRGLTIFHTSDLHGTHRQLSVPDADIMIVSGDATNRKDAELNLVELEDFIDWYREVPIKHKIYVPGNHDAACFKYSRQAKAEFKEANIAYLDKQYITIDGLKFYGDPTTPTFGNWYFMAQRDKIHKHWDMIPDDVDVLVTHGPPKGVLDLTENQKGELEMVGCRNLLNRISKLKNLKLSCFGHIHSSSDVTNNGVLLRNGVCFSNASAVRDGRIGTLFYEGTLIKI